MEHRYFLESKHKHNLPGMCTHVREKSVALGFPPGCFTLFPGREHLIRILDTTPNVRLTFRQHIPTSWRCTYLPKALSGSISSTCSSTQSLLPSPSNWNNRTQNYQDVWFSFKFIFFLALFPSNSPPKFGTDGLAAWNKYMSWNLQRNWQVTQATLPQTTCGKNKQSSEPPSTGTPATWSPCAGEDCLFSCKHQTLPISNHT